MIISSKNDYKQRLLDEIHGLSESELSKLLKLIHYRKGDDRCRQEKSVRQSSCPTRLGKTGGSKVEGVLEYIRRLW